ncbi:hypothetical protein D3C72_819000 [compost metagenome]
MGADEGDVEAADEKAEVEQGVAGVGQGLFQRGLERQAVAGVGDGGLARDPQRQGNDQGDHAAQDEQGDAPVQGVEHPLRSGDHQELTEGAAGGDDAEGQGALLGRDGAADGAQDHDEGHPRHRQADHDAEAEHEAERIGGRGRHGQTGQIDQGAADRDLAGAVLVGPGSDEGLDQAEQQVLGGDDQAKGLAVDLQIQTDGVQEQTEGLAHAHRQGDDHRPGQDHDPGAARQAGSGGRGSGVRHRFQARSTGRSGPLRAGRAGRRRGSGRWSSAAGRRPVSARPRGSG